MDARIRARRRAVAAASARRRRRVTHSVVTLLLLILGAGALATTPLFDVETVRVTGVTRAQAAEVSTVAAVVPGQNLLRVDRRAISEAVTALPWVASTEVTRIPPATVRIAVTPRRPVVVVRVLDASWLVDDHGVVVAGGDRPGLAVVEAPDSVVPAPGAVISDAAIRNALAVREGLPGPLRTAVDRYEAHSERGLRLHMVLADGESAEDEGIWIRFGAADRIDAKVRAIGLLLEQARAQAHRQGHPDLGIAELDVRAPETPVLIPAPVTQGVLDGRSLHA